MWIAFDLDDVLSTFVRTFLLEVRQHLGESIRYEDVSYWGFFGDEKYRTLMHSPGMFRKPGVVTGAQQMVQMLMLAGCEVYVISAAELSDVPDKVWWLSEYFPFIPRKNFVPEKNKAKYAQPGRVLIDDKPDTIVKWRAAGGIGIVFDQPWNRDVPGPRLTRWADLPDLLASLEGAGAA